MLRWLIPLDCILRIRSVRLSVSQARNSTGTTRQKIKKLRIVDMRQLSEWRVVYAAFRCFFDAFDAS